MYDEKVENLTTASIGESKTDDEKVENYMTASIGGSKTDDEKVDNQILHSIVILLQTCIIPKGTDIYYVSIKFQHFQPTSTFLALSDS